MKEAATVKPRGLIVVGVLVVSLGLFAWRSSRQSSHGSPSAQEAPEAVSELSALRAEVAQLRDRQNREVGLLAASAVSNAAAAPAQREEPLTQEQIAVKSEEKSARIAETLAQKVHSERIDVDWSASATAQIRTTFKTTLPGTEVMDAQCASTLCRIVVRHPEKGDQDEMAHKLARQEPFAQGTFFRYDRQSDPPKTTLFVLRDGQFPPEVSNL
jgi:hypothetical protein